MTLDEKAQAFRIDAARSACVAEFAQAYAFDGALLDEFVKPRTAYAETIAGIGNAKVFNRHRDELGLCRGWVRHKM